MASGKKEKKSGSKAEKHDIFTKIVGEYIENLLRKEVVVDDEIVESRGGGGREASTSGFNVDDFKEKFEEGIV